jgi:beta-xylosidase
MKTLPFCTALFLAGALATPLCAEDTVAPGSNPIFRDTWTADPAPLVVGDTLYLYCGHDDAHGDQMFNMPEWLCYSTKDLIHWTAHGPVMKPTDYKWAIQDAWAAQAVQKNGKFYLYTPVRKGEPNVSMAIGVAVSESPTGPFVDARGTPLVTDEMTTGRSVWNDIDPTVFIDNDGKAYLAWGNGNCYIAPLKDNMIELAGEIREIPLSHYVEGPWLYRRGDLYYMVYAGMNEGEKKWETIRYATAKSLEGPWEDRGVLTGTTRNSFTIHPGIVEFNGKWILFYHDANLTLNGEGGALGRRAVCAEFLKYNDDGTIKPIVQTDAGLSAGTSCQ